MKNFIFCLVMLFLLCNLVYSQLFINPANLDFGVNKLNSKVTQKVEITNNSLKTVTFGQISLSDSAEFKINNISSSSIQPGKKSTILIDYLPTKPIKNSTVLSVPIQTVGLDYINLNITGRGATTYILDTEKISDINVWQMATLAFFINCSTFVNPEFTMSVESDKEIKNISLNVVTGLFVFEPQQDQFGSFYVEFKAKANSKEISQKIKITIMPSLPPELVTVGVGAEVIPDSCTNDYTVYSEIKDTVGKLNKIIIDSTLNSLTIIGKTLVFDKNDVRNLAESYSGNTKTRFNLKEVNLIAERIIIREPIYFLQSNVNIIANELRFEDNVPGQYGYISTEPDTLLPVNNAKPVNGSKGFTAGSINLKLNKFYAQNDVPRFYLKGGNGQSIQAVDSIPGDGGNGGNFSCNKFSNEANGIFNYVDTRGGYPGFNKSYVRSGNTGSDGSMSIIDNNNKDWIDPTWLLLVMNHMKDAYLVDCNNYVSSMAKHYFDIMEDYIKSPEFQSKDNQTKCECNQIFHDLKTLLSRLESNLDYFGNVPGWVPMLSFEFNYSNYQNEINNSLPILAYTNWAQATTKRLERIMNDQRKLISNLKTQNDTLNAQFTRINVLIPQVRDEIELVAKNIDDAQQAVINLEERLRQQAEKNINDEIERERKKNMWRNVAKTVGEICAALPVGMPYTTIAGLGLQAAANYDSNDPLGSIMGGYNELKQANPNNQQENEFTSDLNSIFSNFKTGKDSLNKMLNSDFSKVNNISDLKKLYNPSVGSSISNIMSSVSSITQKINSRFKRVKAPKDKIEAEFQRLLAESPEFRELEGRIDSLNNQKEKLVKLIDYLVREIYSLNNNMMSIYLLVNSTSESLDNKKSKYDARVGVHLKNMERQVKERLLTYNYWLKRSYEYRFLKPYPGDRNPFEWSDRLVKLMVDSSDSPQGYDTFVKQMKNEFQNNLSNIAFNVISDYQNNTAPKQTKNSFSLTKDQIKSLNRGDTLTINPKLGLGLILNDVENVRVYKFNYDKVNVIPVDASLPEPTSAHVNLDIVHSGISLINKLGEYYKFFHYTSKTTRPYTWTLNYDYKTNSVNEVKQISSSAASLLQTLVNKPIPIEEGTIYGLPGLNADFSIYLKNSNTDYPLMLDTTTGKELVLIVDYEYETNINKYINVQVVQDNLQPLIYLSKLDVSKKKQNAYGSFERTYEEGQNVQIQAPEKYGAWIFDHWTNKDGKSKFKDSTSATQSFDMNKNYYLNAVYYGPVTVINLVKSKNDKDTLKELTDTVHLRLLADYLDGRRNLDRTNLTDFRLITDTSIASLKDNILYLKSIIKADKYQIDSIRIEARYVENGVELYDTASVYFYNIINSIESESNSKKENNLSVSPNPASKELSIKFNIENNKESTIQIMDMTGRIIKSYIKGKLPSGAYEIKHNTDDFLPGVYFVSLISGDKTITEKVIIIK